MPSSATPFTIRVPDAVLDDLAARLRNARWPGQLEGAGWNRGTELRALRDLASEWENRYRWREHESELNRLHHFQATVAGTTVHFIHERGIGERPMPIVLTHGWPSSFYEYTKLIPLLTDPVGHGGRAEDAFDVVIPSLPGYGFSDRLRPPNDFGLVPQLWKRLMTDVLGYPRFGAHGDDIGAMVTNRLGIEFPDELIGIHVTFPAEPYLDPDAELSPAERRVVDERPANYYWNQAYAHVQSTRPQTLAYSLTDSPIGMAAWMIDKIRDWCDCDGDLPTRFTDAELLTWLTLFWVTHTADSALDPYWDWALGGSRVVPTAGHDRRVPPGVAGTPLEAGQRIGLPAAVTMFTKSMDFPREWAERAYADLRRWTTHERGGHFPAWEEPEVLATELREFYRPLRGELT